VKIVGNSKGVMAGGDLRLNNRKLKVKALPKIFLILLKLTLLHLTWVTNYMLLKFLPDFKIMHPDNTVICQVKILCAAMKAAQEAAKLQKHLQKENNFHHIKSISFNTGAFFLHLFFLIICF
jgi:large subunit ribosomal protein L25